MGIYVFGGEKENKKPTNELFYIRAKERKPLALVTFSEDTVECFKPVISGKPPIPRSRHCVSFIMDKFLVIYGGYNPEYDSGIINDVILLNLHSLQWEPLAVFGYHPEPRYWCTSATEGTRIFVMGGYPAFSDPALHVLELDPKKVYDELQTRKRLIAIKH